MVRRMMLVGHSDVKRLQNFCDSYLCNFGFSERDADVFYVALDGATLIEGLTCRRMYLSDVAALNPYIYVGQNNLRAPAGLPFVSLHCHSQSSHSLSSNPGLFPSSFSCRYQPLDCLSLLSL
jgi:hypothetical protein